MTVASLFQDSRPTAETTFRLIPAVGSFFSKPIIKVGKMMTTRFLLVIPFYPISETPSPPLGLAFLAAALEKSGIGGVVRSIAAGRMRSGSKKSGTRL